VEEENPCRSSTASGYSATTRVLLVRSAFIVKASAVCNRDRSIFQVRFGVVSPGGSRALGAGVLRGAAIGVAAQTLAEEVPGPMPALRDLFSC